MALMKRTFSLLIALCLAGIVQGDVKQESTTKLELKGALGTLAKLTGANKPIRQVQYLKGNLLRTDTVDKKGKLKQTQIVDLDRRVFINIDHKKKQYQEMTFEEWKEMVESGLGSIFSGGPESEEGSEAPEAEVDWTLKVDIDTPGESKDIAGHPTERIDLKLTLEAEVTTEEEGQEPKKAKGGLIVKSTNWMAKSGQNELQEFSKRLAEELGFAPGQGGLADVLAKIMKNNEQLAEAMKILQEEGEKLGGVPLEVHTVFETWGEKIGAQQQQEQSKTEVPKSFGGLMKRFGKKKKKDKDDANILLKTKMAVNKYETAPLSDDVFAVPAKYKKKEVARE